MLSNSMQTPLKLPLQLKWKKGPDMPGGMKDAQSTLVQGTLYIGGGSSDGGIGYMVMAYGRLQRKLCALFASGSRGFVRGYGREMWRSLLCSEWRTC